MTSIESIGALHRGADRKVLRVQAGRCLARMAAVLTLLAGLLTALPAAADALEEIELLRSGEDAVVRIRFSVRVQYLRHLTLGNDGADIFFQFGVATSPALADEVRRVNETPAFPGIAVELPLQQRGGQPSRLNVRFTRPVKFIVRQFGGNAIDVVVAGLGAQVTVTRPQPGGALPPVPADQRYAVRLQTFVSRDMPDARPVPREFQEFVAFTSQSVIDGRPVYELLLGYFANQADAEGARRRLATRFPEAQVIDLARRRDEALRPAAAPSPAVPPLPPPVAVAPLPPAPLPSAPLPPVRAPEDVERQATDLMRKSRAALEAKASHDAIESLNQLLTLPPNSQSEPAQELIGVARELNGEVSKARAEYELYLKLFPSGPGAERVRQRLAQLGTTAVAAGTPQTQRRERPPLKTVTGSVSQYYYGGQSRIENVFNTPTNQERSSFSAVDQSQLLTTVDLNGRYRSGNTEQRIVFRNSYSLSFLSDRDSYNRLNAAYYDYRGLAGGLSARLGRQTGLGGGLPGRFDGGIVGYGSTQVRLNLAGGEPVEFNKIDSRRRFVDMNLEVGGLAGGWNGNLFGIYQETDGILDRQAVGGEIRFVDGVRSLYVLGDYDTSYRVMNAASVQGSWTTRGGTSINLLWDRRRAPTLTTTNAIIGQPTTSISTLLQTSTEDQIRQAALDITAVAVQGSIGLTTPVSERWQVGADARLINVGALPEVVFNGVTLPAQPATGDVVSYNIQAIGTRLYSPRDSNVWSAGYATAPTYDSWLATYNNVTHLSERWSIEPSIRFYSQTDVTEIKLVRLSPGLRLIWRPTLWSSIELDGLWEQTKTTSANFTDTARRYFYSLGYRLDI
ncbi:MAG: outer membrane protein assembly factor BamD [Burkholderiaceae bacterium]|jgi:hypothetical protein|nr:outer membrane protein assembly factor BamD [Burkholderiaceae bacterium]